VPAQIAVLVALTAKLFDVVPLERMTEAEHAVREAAAGIPAEVSARFEAAAGLSEEDRTTILDIAQKALAPFQPKPPPTEPKSATNVAKPEVKPAPKVARAGKKS